MDHAYVGYFHIWPPQANNMNKSWTMVNMVKTITIVMEGQLSCNICAHEYMQ
jgi:chitinase